MSASGATKEDDTEIVEIKQLAREVVKAPSKAVKARSEASSRQQHEFLPSLYGVTDINESILKDVGEKFELIPDKLEVEAVSPHPQFSVIHLQVLILVSVSTKRFNYRRRHNPPPSFFDEFEKQFVAVCSFGGDCEHPIYGIRLLVRQPGHQQKEETLRIDSPMSTREFLMEILYDPSCRQRNDFRRWIGGTQQQFTERMFDIIDKGKAANPFATTSSDPCRLSSVNNLLGWGKYLLSEECSDITVVCFSDGITFPAHRFVLSVSSPYFKTYFSGPWSKQKGDHHYSTQIDSNIMKHILSYMYTGRFLVSVGRLSVDTICKMLQTGQELQMDKLVEACCKILKPRLSPDNIKMITCVGNTAFQSEATTAAGNNNPQSNKLWKYCIEFIQNNASKILFDCPDFVSLATENPNLWQALKKEISPSSSSSSGRKRTHDEIEHNSDNNDDFVVPDEDGIFSDNDGGIDGRLIFDDSDHTEIL